MAHPQRPWTGEGARWLALTQGAYFVATSVWPLVWMAGFVAVTGPKQDR